MRLHHTLTIPSLCHLTTSRAQAQTQTDASKLETIVVTAQKRSQSAQKVPMTISALDARKLQQPA